MERSAAHRSIRGYGQPPRLRRARMRATHALAALGLILGLGVGILAHAAIVDTGPVRLYRYKNAEGKVEIAHAVPADRVAGGYDVLDGRGQVIETVGAQLTADELAAKEARDREANVCRQNVERVNALYGSPEDVDAAEEQARQSLDARIANLESSLRLERRRLVEREGEAAQRERTGRKVTADLQQSIEHSRAQIDAIGVEIAQRHEEQEIAKARFAEDRRLFATGECEPRLVQAAP